jgi:hypothetical protein
VSVFRRAFGSGSIGLWIFITLLSAFMYNLYWFFRNGLWQAAGLIAGGFPNNYVDATYWVSHVVVNIGMVFGIFGLFLGMWAVYSIWGPKKETLLKVRYKASSSSFIVGLFFLSFFPSGFWLLTLEPIPQTVLAISYFLQPILAVPVLFILAYKILNHRNTAFSFSIFQWFGAAYLGITAALWLSDSFVWVQMFSTYGLVFLQIGGVIFGFLNSATLTSASLIFAGAAFLAIMKRTKMTLIMKLLGISMALMGLHFIFYIAYYASVNALGWILLGNIWALPLLGLGLSLLLNASSKNLG